ncbi:MAG: hypothetical protein PHY91_04450 [Tissierellia bacterium]|nr:hypothetical protein [Tissierellia bacterium]MDD4725417.1 hypothetical protein [Tissierellia bacterium]
MDCNHYKEYTKKNLLKYIPDFVLPQIRPRVIEEIIEDENIIGRVGGINLKQLNYLDDVQWQRYIEGIKSILDEETILYIEGSEKFPKEILIEIEKETDLEFSSGNNIRIKNLPSLLREVYKHIGRDINSTDTLLICDDGNTIMETIELLRDDVKFFTVYGIAADDKEEFYADVFNNTGISIFQPNNIKKVIKNYGTIVNFCNKIDIEVFDFRNHSVIIDFSYDKPFKILKNKKDNIIYIQDINFKSDIISKWIGEYVNPELFLTIGKADSGFKQIYMYDGYYYIEEYISKAIIKRGRI